jgi:hypothetical protein
VSGEVPFKIDCPLKISSLSGLLTLLVAIGIIFIGIREFLYPGIAARGFGVPLMDPATVNCSRSELQGMLHLEFWS